MKKQPIPSITGILLAAGLSTRMGVPKQLLPFGESTIVETVVDNMLNAKFTQVIVIVGHCAEQVQDILGERKVKVILNPDYEEGMLTSAQTGVRSLKIYNEMNRTDKVNTDIHLDNVSGFSLMLVDQPFITSDLINSVIEAYAKTDKGIVLPSYNLRRGHPVIFHYRYAEAILKLDAFSGGVRSLYNTFSDDIYYVSVDTDDVIRDIDDPDDYKHALTKLS